MIKNYFKIAWRNLWKNKLFSFINIMGLGLAIPFALLSLLQVQSTFEFDNFHLNSDRIYRIITDETPTNGKTVKYASSPYLLSDNLKNDYACVDKSTKVVRDFGWELNNRIKTLKINTIYVEPTFFEIFNFSLEKGTLPTEPNTLVLTHEMAETFFNDINPIGKTLSHPTFGLFTVTGVLKPYKKGTQFKSDVMVSMATYTNFKKDATKPQSWADYETHTFVRLKPNTQPQALDAAIQEVAKKSNNELVFAKKTHQFRKQSLKDISPDFENLRYNPYVSDLEDFYFNFGMALAIILLAGFNYTNLTLARSLSRAKEVGIRKVAGAARSQLVIQFTCEAVLIALFSLGVGMVILELIYRFAQVNWFVWEVENQTLIGVVFIVFTLILGILAGILPAWILSSFQPVNVLKGTLSPASFGKINFRKSLVVIQFVVTMCFVFWIGHLYNQFQYMANDNDNFNRKNIFNISLADDKFKLLKNDIATHRNVERIGLTSTPFGSEGANYMMKANRTSDNLGMIYYAVDSNFINNMQLTFVAGKNLPITHIDSAGNFVLINEHTVSALNLGTPQEAIGKTVFVNDRAEFTVTGVLKNFCYSNYQREIVPLVFHYNPSEFHVLSIKTSSNTAEKEFIADMKAIWKRHYPTEEMGFSWYQSDMYERYYPTKDMQFSWVASFMVFVIAMMGLLGMVTYEAEKRVKEIGIRKVIGATVFEIVKILSWRFVKLLLIAGCIALPIGYISGSMLLGIFTFHAPVNIGLMVLIFCGILGIALLTIGIKAVRSAVANPVKSLRTE
jgi:putative ABC transport system permease protein